MKAAGQRAAERAAGGRAYHLRQLDVREAADESLAEAGELLQKAVVVLFDHLVLLLYCLQVTFHR